MSLLSCTQLSLQLGQKTVIDSLSAALQPGELVGLIGPNGAGKSSLLRAFAGVLPISSGEIFLQQRPLLSYSTEQRAQQLAWLAQSGPINWPLSVERLVALGRNPHQRSWGGPSGADLKAIEQALESTDCQALRHRDATSLSGGERARVLLARALAAEPTVLLADEPVASLDLSHQLQTMELLRQFARHNRACLVVLHELSLAARYCDRLLLIDHGKVVSDGTVKEVLNQESLRQVYGVEADIVFGEHPWVIPKRRI